MLDKIYYDRKFIRVSRSQKEDLYIPLILSGDLYMSSGNARYTIVNPERDGRVLFTAEEIHELSRSSFLKQYVWRNQDVQYSSGDIENFYANGWKEAYSVEDYSKFSNVVEATLYERGVQSARNKITTTKELLWLIYLTEKYKDYSLDISFAKRPDSFKAFVPQRKY